MDLRICVDLPMRAVGEWASWSGGLGLGDLGLAVEAAGLDGLAMSDHPVPGVDWLAQGGHHTFDPFVAFGAVAVGTSRIRLVSNLAVAPYRSPYVLAKAATTVDVVSGGRLILGVGPGYVEEEFAAIGADFHRRGRATDRALEVLRQVWTGEEIRSESGSRHVVLPRPVHDSCPIWIGGNSAAAMRRVARYGDGWLPFLQTQARAAVTGTDLLTSVEQVAERVDAIRTMRVEIGRPADFDVCLAPARIGKVDLLLEFLDSHGDACAQAGITWLTWQLAARSGADAVRAIEEAGRSMGRRSLRLEPLSGPPGGSAQR